MTIETPKIIQRFLRWFLTSCWADLLLSVMCFWVYTVQHGWQRWLWFSAFWFYVLLFWNKAGERWGKK